MKYAVIDVGTNNILFLIARKDGEKLTMLHRDANISALGKNMKGNLLRESAVKRTKVILNDNIQYAKLFTENIIVVGTSCSREAENINLLSDWLQQRHGLKYNIISGKKEAYFNGLANIKEFPEFSDIVMFDVGGGSTEFTISQNGKIIFNKSLPLGIRRLDNEFSTDMAKKVLETKKLLQNFELPEIEKAGIVGIGGTVTSLSAFKQRLFKYDGSKVHKSRLTISEVDVMLDEFANMTNDEIAYLIPFDRQRADILTTGTMIVREILNRLGVFDFLVSDRGLQFGILLQNPEDLNAML
ncbi:MAG: hypothetical protein K9N09_06810 [Candidatus Cloacimonetes bacterium]|nr:hypothetical protein [Candidatus Cloacimonadota bacterium]MCF7814317.1 hypothetical protein [Candidatus Cloacimonadota bacterium]MCF7868394.1 hypothetical protein [Candidatus Cloacimonadota bacterium]MCF7883841.1 hypothetical protein [Candidatus Cloacimonadota bacterium]